MSGWVVGSAASGGLVRWLVFVYRLGNAVGRWRNDNESVMNSSVPKGTPSGPQPAGGLTLSSLLALVGIWTALAGSITAWVAVLLPAPTVARVAVFIASAAVWGLQAVVAALRLSRAVMVLALVACHSIWFLLAYGLDRPIPDNVGLISLGISLQLTATVGGFVYRKLSLRRRFGRGLTRRREHLLVLSEDPPIRLWRWRKRRTTVRPPKGG
jgi:hypothetical protein